MYVLALLAHFGIEWMPVNPNFRYQISYKTPIACFFSRIVDRPSLMEHKDNDDDRNEE